MRGMFLALTLTAVGLGAAVALSGDVAAGDGAAGEKAGAHAHFNGQGVLSWKTTLADALKAAKKQNKLVLIEYGREA